MIVLILLTIVIAVIGLAVWAGIKDENSGK